MSVERRGRMLSVDSKRTVFKRRRLQFPPRRQQVWKESTIVLSCSKIADSSPSRKKGQRLCRKYHTGNCTNPSCDYWHPPVCQNYKNRDANSSIGVFSRTLRLTVSPVKSRRKVVEKDRVPCLKKFKKHIWVAYSTTQSRRSPSRFYGRAQHFLGSDRTVRFSKRHGTPHKKKRERKGPSQGVIQKCEPHVHSFCASNFDDRTQEETLQQERCARREAWILAKNVLKLNDEDKAKFISFAELWSLTAASSRKENLWSIRSVNSPNSAELETVRVFKNPTTVTIANGQVQTNGETTVYVHDLELFVTVQILDDTLVVLSSGKDLRRTRMLI